MTSAGLDSFRAEHGVGVGQDCASKARAVLPAELLAALEAGRAGDEAFRRLTRAEEKSLLGNLLRLRQACCHPQVPTPDPKIKLQYAESQA